MTVLTHSVTSPTTGYPYLDEPAGVIAFAHRGGAFTPGIEPFENTLRAFQDAYDRGFRYFETDVHVTRDGVLLAFHDDVLDRVTDALGRVADLTHDEVRRARIGGSEAVPTLAELVGAFPEARFNVDVKAGGAVAPLVDLIEADGLHDRVLVGSFSRRRLRAFRRSTGGRVATSAHPAEVAAYILLPGRLAAALTRCQALQIPHRTRGLTVASRRLVRRAHATGVHVHVWTIDDPDEMRELLDLGVDGLMTDRTDILRSVLTERGQWVGP